MKALVNFTKQQKQSEVLQEIGDIDQQENSLVHLRHLFNH